MHHHHYDQHSSARRDAQMDSMDMKERTTTAAHGHRMHTGTPCIVIGINMNGHGFGIILYTDGINKTRNMEKNY